LLRAYPETEISGTDTHGVRPRRIVEGSDNRLQPAFGGKLGGNGGDVAAGALHPPAESISVNSP